jgi:hypothetical protein
VLRTRCSKAEQGGLEMNSFKRRAQGAGGHSDLVTFSHEESDARPVELGGRRDEARSWPARFGPLPPIQTF